METETPSQNQNEIIYEEVMQSIELCEPSTSSDSQNENQPTDQSQDSEVEQVRSEPIITKGCYHY